MTAQELIDSLPVRYQDADKTFWSDTELLSYLNQAVRVAHNTLVARNDPSIVTVETVTTESGTQEYDLPSGFVAIHRGGGVKRTGVWVDNVYLEPRGQEIVGDALSEEEGFPRWYYITTSTIGFVPTPDDEYVVNYMYYGSPTTLGLDSSLPYNDIFDDAFSAYVNAMALLRGTRDASAYAQLYNELERRVLATLSIRSPTKPRIVVRR